MISLIKTIITILVMWYAAHFISDFVYNELAHRFDFNTTLDNSVQNIVKLAIPFLVLLLASFFYVLRSSAIITFVLMAIWLFALDSTDPFAILGVL